MDNKTFQIKVLERLATIETTLKEMDYKAIVDELNDGIRKIIELDKEMENNSKRIDKIEDNEKWLWRTVGGAIILGILAVVFKI